MYFAPLALFGFQDAAQPASQVTQRDVLVGAVTALVPTLILLWKTWRKSSRADRTDTIAEYKDLYKTQTENLTKALAANGLLTDRLTAEQVKNGRLEAENKYLKEELKQYEKAGG